ncbi:MAG: LytTR family transcriptional regulator, partial [Sphingobacteriales bacterium]
IVYIEGLDDYIRINLESQKPVVARLTMKALLEKLPAKDFARVHRSFIVPLKGIRQVRNKIITIGDTEIAIGSSFEEGFFEKFKG